ncbi:hypothetical protein Btru_023201 [Bulinus truncatus]|nr:hypothetical protein Btru_023201 [Bulinus truncatus]
MEKGGRLRPSECVPRQRLAIIIPYRNRYPHLHIALHNLIPLLKRQQADVTFFVIEQIILSHNPLDPGTAERKYGPRYKDGVWVMGPRYKEGVWVMGPRYKEGVWAVGPRYKEGVWAVGSRYKEGVWAVGPRYKGVWAVGPRYKAGVWAVGPRYKEGVWAVGPRYKDGVWAVDPRYKEGVWAVGPRYKAGVWAVGPRYKAGVWAVGPRYKDGVLAVGPRYKEGVWTVGPRYKDGVWAVGPRYKDGVWAVGPRYKEGVWAVGPTYKEGVWAVGPRYKAGVWAVGPRYKDGVLAVGPRYKEGVWAVGPRYKDGVWAVGPRYKEGVWAVGPRYKDGVWAVGPRYKEGVWAALPSTFNRGALLNIGFLEAEKRGNFDCYIFHDVDLIPLSDRNIYRCESKPRHYAVAINKYKYKLPYPTYFGGVVGFSREQYLKVNGNSNLYIGWGGEDDDLLKRLKMKRYVPDRYPVNVSRYHMIKHTRDKGNEANPLRKAILKSALHRQDVEGLNTVKYKVLNVTLDHLYTWITVSVNTTEILMTAPWKTLKDVEEARKTWQREKIMKEKKAAEIKRRKNMPHYSNMTNIGNNGSTVAILNSTASKPPDKAQAPSSSLSTDLNITATNHCKSKGDNTAIGDR